MIVSHQPHHLAPEDNQSVQPSGDMVIGRLEVEGEVLLCVEETGGTGDVLGIYIY